MHTENHMLANKIDIGNVNPKSGFGSSVKSNNGEIKSLDIDTLLRDAPARPVLLTIDSNDK